MPPGPGAPAGPSAPLPGGVGSLAAGRLLTVAAADDDRAAVVADVLRRAAARRRLVVRLERGGPDRLDLNVPPPDAPGPVAGAAGTGGTRPVDVAVGAVAAPARHRLPVPPWTRPAGVRGDPLAARLLLLATPLPEPVDAGALPAADRRLHGWRDAVGAWARQPSAPAPDGVVAAVRAAVDVLDTPRALDLLDALAADDTVAPGARMEAFLALDRLLGLDLALGLAGA